MSHGTRHYAQSSWDDVFHPYRQPEPPPGPDEIDAWLALPLAPEVAECLACNWSECLVSLYQTGIALRTQCMADLIVSTKPRIVTRRSVEDMAQVLSIILRKQDSTIAQLVAASGTTYSIVRNTLDWMREHGLVAATNVGDGKHYRKVWHLVSVKLIDT